MCKKLIKNSQPFGKKFQKTVGGDFFLTHTVDFVVIASRSFAGGYNYITPRRVGLSATAGLSCILLSS